jgi:Zn-dependent protease with chaperone function
LLFFRLAWCFNPVALLVFRRIAQENEKVCDQLAARVTHDPLALAASIVKVFKMSRRLRERSSSGQSWRRVFALADNLEQHGSRMLVEERVERIIEERPVGRVPYERARLALTGACLAALLFFVV